MIENTTNEEKLLEVGYESMKEQNKKELPTHIAAGSPLAVNYSS